MIITFIIALMLRMMGPKYLEAIPILMVLMIAKVKAIPQNIRPAELNTSNIRVIVKVKVKVMSRCFIETIYLWEIIKTVINILCAGRFTL